MAEQDCLVSDLSADFLAEGIRKKLSVIQRTYKLYSGEFCICHGLHVWE